MLTFVNLKVQWRMMEMLIAFQIFDHKLKYLMVPEEKSPKFI